MLPKLVFASLIVPVFGVRSLSIAATDLYSRISPVVCRSFMDNDTWYYTDARWSVAFGGIREQFQRIE